MDDFVQLLIAAIVAIGWMFGAKKKKGPTPDRTSPPASRKGVPDRSGTVTAQDIERILRMEIPGIQVEEEPEAELEPELVQQLPTPLIPAPTAVPESSWQAGIRRSALTVETLESAGAARHERFHQMYVDRPADTPETGTGPSMDEVRRAIIWKEILDPPVSSR